MCLPLVFVAAIGFYTRRYVRSVADFMAGGRCAGRYLMCTARSGMGGAVTFVAGYQVFLRSGFILRWWGYMSDIVALIVIITGFVIYRYRQTRAMTLAQFFEMRYSRKFRLFCGGLGFLAGIINYGIIPVIGARLCVYLLQLPPTVQFFSHRIDTCLPLMAIFLTISTLLVTLGGQVTVLATDCAEGMFGLIASLIICIALLITFNVTQTREVLVASATGMSLANPFDAWKVQDFNFWYAMVGMFGMVYGTMAWQNAQAFNSCALNPHEARMGGILGNYRGIVGILSGTLLSLAVLSYLDHPNNAAGAAVVRDVLSRIDDPATRDQMLGPVVVTHLLPIGIRGLLCSTLLMGIFSTDGMHLHSWSSILIQDVILPLRKRPLGVRQHLLLLRLGIILVAIFAFIFGALFRQSEYVQMWFGVTQAIFTGGAGAVIIGGLYWPWGTTAGAWVGMLTGSILSLVGIVLRQPFWNEQHPALWVAPIVNHLGAAFPLNGTYISLYASLAALTGYVVISWLTCGEPHNMDRLLHRGAYALEADRVVVGAPLRRFDLAKFIGIDELFTRSDRWLTLGMFSWKMFWLAVFVVGCTIELVHPLSAGSWSEFWLWNAIWIPLPIGVVTTIWFTIACTKDMKTFFRKLRAERIDPEDDGTVEHRQAAVIN